MTTTDIDVIFRQRAELKRGDPDMILLFRVEDAGEDVYQTFGLDALAMCRIDFDDAFCAGANLTICFFGPDADSPTNWARFPAADLEKMLPCIVAAGKRAAVLERVQHGQSLAKAEGGEA